jgi:hypothetical protein
MNELWNKDAADFLGDGLRQMIDLILGAGFQIKVYPKQEGIKDVTVCIYNSTADYIRTQISATSDRTLWRELSLFSSVVEGMNGKAR